MKLNIHSQTSMVATLKFGNGYVMSSQILQWMKLLSMLGIKVIHVNKIGPWSHVFFLGCSLPSFVIGQSTQYDLIRMIQAALVVYVRYINWCLDCCFMMKTFKRNWYLFTDSVVGISHTYSAENKNIVRRGTIACIYWGSSLNVYVDPSDQPRTRLTHLPLRK